MGNSNSSQHSQSDGLLGKDVEHLQEVREYFLKSYPNGLLTKAEFLRQNKHLHPNTADEFWESLFHSLDHDDNGFIDLREYLIAYSIVSDMNVRDSRLSFWFKLLDKDGSGSLSYEECEFLFATLIEMSDILRFDSSGSNNNSERDLSSCSSYSESFDSPSTSFDGNDSFTFQEELCIKGDIIAPGGASLSELNLVHSTEVVVNGSDDSSTAPKLGDGETVESVNTVELIKEKFTVEKLDEQLVAKMIADIFARMDLDGDGSITFEEFATAVQEDELLQKLLYVEISVERLSQLHYHANVQPQNFEFQVAGHGSEEISKTRRKSIFKKKKQNQHKGIKKIDNHIWKPLDKTEFDFYEYTYNPVREKDPIIQELKEFLPKYYGRSYIEFDKKKIVYYIIMEDLLHNMADKPCVMDLKIGTRGYDSRASLRKRAQQIAFCNLSTSRSLGFRFCGYKSHDFETGKAKALTKLDGGFMRVFHVESHLLNFINNGTCIRYDVYKIALGKLRRIRAWFSKQKRFQFYSSSLLIAYSASEKPGTIGEDDVVVKMVDFAHTDIDESDNTLDLSYIAGLDSLISLLEEIVKE